VAERVVAVAEANSEAGRNKATAALEKATKAAKEAADAAAKHATALKVLDFQLLGMRNRIDEATLSLEQHLSTWVDFKEMDLSGDIEALNRALGQGPELNPNVIGSQIAAGKAGMDAARKVKISWEDALHGVADLFGSFSSSADDAFARIANAAASAAQAIQNVNAAGGMGTAKGKGMAVAGALSTAGSFFGDSKAGGALRGAGQGAAIGTMILPGWGTAIGAAVGAIAGFIGAGKKLQAELKKIKESFVDSMGGMDALKAKAKEAGVSLDAMFKAKNKDALLKALDQVKEKLDTWNEANEELQAAIDKYGFSIEELGPKFRQQELDRMAAGLLQDYKLLTASGIDNTLVISKMGPAMNEYVQTALRAGIAVPIAMKPQIDAMIAAGQLLDANGNAYASAEAAGITYAQTMSDMFTQLMDRVGQLVNALLGIPNVTTTVTTVHEDVFRGGGDPFGGGGKFFEGDATQDDFAAAGGFHGMVSRPTRLLVGEGGPERVDVTPRGERAPGAGTSISLNPTFKIDPLQSNAGRADLGKFLMQQFFREARNSPMLRQVLREGGR
jgi:gas vesicle protein